MWIRFSGVFTWKSCVSGIILHPFMMMLQPWFWLMKRFVSYDLEFFIIGSFLMCLWNLLPVFYMLWFFLGLISSIIESQLPFQNATICTVLCMFSKRVSGITSLISMSFPPPTQSSILGTLISISSLSGIHPFGLCQK